LYHGLVAPAVERVGRAWTEGEISLTGMMRASLRTWRILCDLRDAFVLVTDRVPGQEAVFALCPGECHTLGLTMTADDLRRHGWEVELLIGYGHDELVARMDRLSPTTVALAATGIDMVLPLARLVVALRAHLPGVWIMVGGSITERVDGILALTGADAVANTADEAERLMQQHIADRAARRVNRI
jgi:methanogenic corrinoid protein MtbC1